MGQVRARQKVKLITGFIFKDEGVFNKAEGILKKRFGKIDFQSQTLPFTHTDYYEKEFGKGLKRVFVSFEKLILHENLPQIKILTNKIEHKLAKGSCRLSGAPQTLVRGSLLCQEIPRIRHPRAKAMGISTRRINIDPGYLDLAKLILASTKDFRHRIYLNKGIYADLTLFYQNKTFQTWEWTFPDYKTAEYIAIFNQIREIYTKQIKNVSHIPGSAP